MKPPFQRLLDEHAAGVFRFLFATVGPHAADDCFQETFLSALRAYPRLRHTDNLKSWLFTIAHRKALDWHRAARRTIPSESLPETAVEDAPANGEIWALVGGLPPKQRAAVAHRYVNDLTYKDIATVMGSTEEAARRNVHEGIKKLREVLSP